MVAGRDSWSIQVKTNDESPGESVMLQMQQEEEQITQTLF